MAWEVTAEVGRFEEAIDWFRSRVPHTFAELGELDDKARAQAFWVAGGVELAAVQNVFDEIAAAIENGTSLEAFKQAVREKLGAKLGISGFHLETVFRNAAQSSYNTGRWYQMTAPDVVSFRPYWMYDAILDQRTTEVCKTLNGAVKRADDEFWLTRWPPLHHRCRSSVRSLRRSEAEKRGITQGTPAVDPQKGFGLAPPVRGDEPPKPDPSKHDQLVWAAYKAREQKMLRELEEAKRKAQAERQKQDPKHWLDTEYRAKYGEDAGRAVAWGRAMEERGKAVSIREAQRQHQLLDDMGISLGGSTTPLFTRLRTAVDDGFIPKDLGTLGEVVTALESAVAKTSSLKPVLDEARALAALIGHRSGIKPAGSAAKLGAPRLARNAPATVKTLAPEMVDKVERFWADLSDSSLSLSDKRTGYIVKWTSKRAYFDPAARVVYTHWIEQSGKLYETGFSTIVHEMGHGLEHLNARARRAAEEFLARRTAGEVARKLRNITGNNSYRHDEVAKEDKFFNPYMGKDYIGRAGNRYATEVSSMALEALHRNSANLVDKDVEAFWFALGQLAGESAQ